MDIVPAEIIQKKILIIRGRKVMLDRDLAELYEVETRILNQAVKRNITRFPDDFMFQLSREEIMRISQIVISLEALKFSKSVMAFTEYGVAMLSSVLNSERAIQVNIGIMRTFGQLREMLSTHKEIKRKIEMMERKYDHQFRVVFDTIKQLIEPQAKPKKRIGFLVDEEK
ncbi:MAG: ORF6N domain-containing protein [Alphaproteobacteria bacterium]|uniref:ORF6N domain-containing protein n=1 Tax=Candidatus Nitrobium versatile TaxID=2884831 RepID=A0A953J391_9BACT|nr:ORF6N domain-containing protein [Candidatus Nitrobium versatile]